ncbi:hypothetical protein [Paenibacillus thermotolerans]|uniref:hypothetical protein n=1 Tax=Paenibacillus thermotolerans TaxID=3027807 RepID=UPI0023674F4A|nr:MULTISPECIES: hypothetical protein [unclassified Paenibacillus]
MMVNDIREIASLLRSRAGGGRLAPRKPWREDVSGRIGRISFGPDAESQALKAGLLLWNDDLDASHSIAQEIETSTGSFWHGIMHRMEGDYGNAKYWFRLTGAHPVFPAIAAKAASRIAGGPPKTLLEGAVRDGKWNPYTFVDIVERAVREQRSGAVPTGAVEIVETIQKDEIEALLSFSFQQVFGGTLFDPDQG